MRKIDQNTYCNLMLGFRDWSKQQTPVDVAVSGGVAKNATLLVANHLYMIQFTADVHVEFGASTVVDAATGIKDTGEILVKYKSILVIPQITAELYVGSTSVNDIAYQLRYKDYGVSVL